MPRIDYFDHKRRQENQLGINRNVPEMGKGTWIGRLDKVGLVGQNLIVVVNEEQARKPHIAQIIEIIRRKQGNIGCYQQDHKQGWEENPFKSGFEIRFNRD